MILLALLLGTLPVPPDATPVAAPATVRAAEIERPARWTLDEIFAALRQVETGGSKSGGRRSVGDGGKAIGRFEDCREFPYARRVVLAYWRRYCPEALEALDAEILARIHNGGPRGDRKESTKVFWRKVERELARRREKTRFC
jgi:hypothetical protein